MASKTAVQDAQQLDALLGAGDAPDKARRCRSSGDECSRCRYMLAILTVVILVLGMVAFLSMHVLASKCYRTSNTPQNTFKLIDEDGDGWISDEELERFRGDKLTSSLKSNFSEAAGRQGAKHMDYQSFERMHYNRNLGCRGRTCEECLAHTDILHPPGTCLWYPGERVCSSIGMMAGGMCEIPINSPGQCWGATCAHQIGQYVSKRPSDAIAWVTTLYATFSLPLMPFVTYPPSETGIFDLATGRSITSGEGELAEGVVVGGASDWGSGTCQAKVVGALMAREDPHITFHLGDVYYMGTPEEYDINVLGFPKNDHQHGVAFPKGSHSTMLLMGNHDILSGGKGLFENGFHYSGQKATYGAWQSDSWRIVALDSGYLSYGFFPGPSRMRNVADETEAPNPAQVVAWLKDVLDLGNPDDKRGIVILTHHQPFSDWEASFLGVAKQLDDILPRGKTVIWFFGHEHRLAFYKRLRVQDAHSNWKSKFSIHPRLVGHGGFPNSVTQPKRWTALVGFANTLYEEIPQIPLGHQKISFNGYFSLNITNQTLKARYHFLKCLDVGCVHGLNETHTDLMAEETYTVDLSSGDVTQGWDFLSEALTTKKSKRRSVHVNASQGQHLPADTGGAAVEKCLPRARNFEGGPMFALMHTSMD